MKTVELLHSGNLVAVQSVTAITIDDIFTLLRDSLSYNLRLRNDWRTKRVTGQAYRNEKHLLCKLVQSPTQPQVVFPQGLLDETVETLTKAGIAHTYKNLTPIALPAPVMENMELDKIREDQLKALAAIFAKDMGIIKAPTAFGKTFLICQLCRAYPNSRIIICSYRNDVVTSIFERLRQHVPASQLGKVSGYKKDVARVSVATIGSLAHAKPEKCQLFLYDEVHEAGAADRAEKLATIRNAKMFGFSASPTGRSDGSDKVVKSLFGPTIYELTYQEAEKNDVVATIKVLVARVDGSSVPYDNEVDQFRYGLWRNLTRNKLIATHALSQLSAGKQVLVIVDKVEHALYLKHAMPSWPLVHGVVNHEQITSFKRSGLLPTESWLCTVDSRDRLREQFERGSLRCAIATGVWSQGVDFKHLDVLVRGDGLVSSIANTQIPGRLSRGEAGLLIDFDDVFDPRFSSRSQRRFRAYKAKGWEMANV